MTQTGSRLTKARIVQAIIESVAIVAPDLGPIGEESYLIGNQAILDSVGFVTLLVALEQNLANAVDLSAVLMEQDGADEANNPFLTVGSLADHIQQLMSARP
jgi:acyl carrier protein